MKIAMIGSIWISIPPQNFGFGAQEYLIYQIVQKLSEKGHEVSLFATADSKVNAKLISVSDIQVKDIPSTDYKIKEIFELINLKEAYRIGGRFDIIHNHLLPYGLLFADSVATPTVHTLHHLIYPDRADKFLYQKFAGQNFISISNNQRSYMPELNYVSTVYNGIDTGSFNYKELPENKYLLYLGRMKKYKGIHEAIAVSNKLRIPLKIASPIPTPSQTDFTEVNDYWKKEIAPALKNNQIEHIDNIPQDIKVSLIQNAKAFIFPVERQEPFGMTLIESLSCGTPVISYANGAVPEIIKDGETGYIINSSDQDIRGDWIIKKTGIEGLCEAVERIYNMPPDQYIQMRKNCRKHVEKNFTIERMVDGYEKVYSQIIGN